MSRCFPFPPQGYTKKLKPEDSSVLKEDKQKEKKQKKEKKDKEKREGKEKKDKERSDGKYRDKKDRKEKHRDKKDKHKEKKKERHKDKDKSSTSETSKITGLSEAKGLEELKAESGKDNSHFAEEKNHTAQSCGQNGDRTVQSNVLARNTEESKFAQELDWRIRVEKKTSGNELVEKFSSLDRKRDDESFEVRNPGNLAEEKSKSRDEQFDNKKMDGQGYIGGNSMVHNLSGTTKGKGEGIPKVVEKNDGRRLGEKEKTKERAYDVQGDKQKDKDRDQKSHGKDKDRDKERKKGKVKEKGEHKRSDREKSKDDSRSSLIGIIDNKSASLSSDVPNNANVGNHKKRKDVDTNGFLHDTEVRSNKLQRPNPHQVLENGRKLEACQIPSLLASDRQTVAAMLRVDENEGRKNGIIGSSPLPATKSKSSSVTADVDQIAAGSRKPPHSDLKYLSQVLSVPKMDEWSEFDDQEWLFTSRDSRNHKVGATGVAEEPQVWSEALHMESADVVALPYVIPY